MLLFQNIRRKTKIGFALALLLLCLVLNNIVNQEHYESIEKAATSIYEDRLMASAYIFELREQLYAMRADSRPDAGGGKDNESATSYQELMAAIIHKYENTVLTRQEQAGLHALKANLDKYFKAQSNTPAAELHFAVVLDNLGKLQQIQQGEGNHLKTDMVNTARTSTLLSYLEICLLIAIAALTLSFIRQSGPVFQHKLPHNPSLN